MSTSKSWLNRCGSFGLAALVLIGALAQPRTNADVQSLHRAVSELTDPIDRGFAREFQLSTIAQPVAPAFVETWVDESLKVPARVWRAALKGVIDLRVPATIARITAPTLVIWGTKDRVTLRADQEILDAGVANSRLAIYEGAGHSVHWEEPSRVAADIAAFAGAVPRRPVTAADRTGATMRMRRR